MLTSLLASGSVSLYTAMRPKVKGGRRGYAGCQLLQPLLFSSLYVPSRKDDEQVERLQTDKLSDGGGVMLSIMIENIEVN